MAVAKATRSAARRECRFRDAAGGVGPSRLARFIMSRRRSAVGFTGFVYV